MRNFRKTRKRGGFNTSVVLRCVKPYDSMTKCEIEFLKLQNLKKFKIPGDGNCFYHALSKYYSLSNPPGSKPPTHLQLRQRVVDVMEEKLDEAKVGLIINMSNVNNNIEENDRKTIEMAKYLEAFEELREDGVWNSDNADVVSQFAARALNVQLNIFNKMDPQPARKVHMRTAANGTKIYQEFPAEPAKIVKYTFEPEGYRGAETINLLRVDDGHYELLYPKPVVAPKGKNPNAIENLTAKVGKIVLSNKSATVKARSRSPSRSAAGPGRAPSRSPPREVTTTGRYALRSRTNKKPAQLAAEATGSPKKAPRRTKANIEAAELQAAIEASLKK